ncbi:TonB-dependent receptor, partial [Brevundimonas nasdae]|uniref:TonB-dependent receptor n=1 Tax=Brevundimonas nasdae TaxID=172043 RepID=UPI00289FAE6B
MKYAYVALATKALLLASAASAMAQSAPPKREPDIRPAAVDDVEVVAQNLEQTLPLTLAQYGSPLEIVTAKQIKDSGFIDVVQALELLVPGVTVSTQAGAFSYANISLQGSRNSDVLWTIDGVRIGNRLYNSTSPADTLPASMVERVEVLKGGQGLFYGTQA